MKLWKREQRAGIVRPDSPQPGYPKCGMCLASIGQDGTESMTEHWDRWHTRDLGFGPVVVPVRF